MRNLSRPSWIAKENGCVETMGDEPDRVRVTLTAGLGPSHDNLESPAVICVDPAVTASSSRAQSRADFNARTRCIHQNELVGSAWHFLTTSTPSTAKSTVKTNCKS